MALTAMTDCGLGYGEHAMELKDDCLIARSCRIASSSFTTRCQWLSLELGNQQKEYQVGPRVQQKVISTKEQAPCANPNVSKVQGGSQGEGRRKGGAERTHSHKAKRKWEYGEGLKRWTRPSITKWPSVPVPHLGVCTLSSNNVTQNRLISRGGIQCIPGMGMWRPGWTEAEKSLKMTPGSERVWGVKGPPLLPPSVPRCTQHADKTLSSGCLLFLPRTWCWRRAQEESRSSVWTR